MAHLGWSSEISRAALLSNLAILIDPELDRSGGPSAKMDN